MGFSVWIELVCLNCAETGCGDHSYDGVPRRKIWRQAKKDGWVRGRVARDEVYCSEECREQWESRA